MSVETKTALEAAISAHIADEYEGDIVTGWVIVTEVTSLEMLDQGESAMIVASRDLQSDYLTRGLLHAALSTEAVADD